MMSVIGSISAMQRFDSVSEIACLHDYFNLKGENILHTLSSVTMPSSGAVLEIASACVKNGAEINAKTCQEQRTPVHYAALSGKDKLIKLLLSHDRSQVVNEVDIDNHTALHFAARNKDVATVYQLLVHGADTSIKNKLGDKHTRLIIKDAAHSKIIDQQGDRALRLWDITNYIMRLLCLHMSEKDLRDEIFFAINLKIKKDIILSYELNVLDILIEACGKKNSLDKNSSVLASKRIMDAYSSKAKSIFEWYIKPANLKDARGVVPLDLIKYPQDSEDVFDEIFCRFFEKEPVRQTEDEAFLPEKLPYSYDSRIGELVSIPHDVEAKNSTIAKRKHVFETKKENHSKRRRLGK